MISKNDVKYIASLSRIYLQEPDVERLTSDLENILGYVDKLKELDVKDVKPTSHVLMLKNIYREDNIQPSLTQQEALKIAPAQHNGFFKVPKIIE